MSGLWSQSFYTKDPEGQFNIFEFDLKDRGIVFNTEENETDRPRDCLRKWKDEKLGPISLFLPQLSEKQFFQ